MIILNDEALEVVAGGKNKDSTKIVTTGYAYGKQKDEYETQLVQNGVASTGGSVSIHGSIR